MSELILILCMAITSDVNLILNAGFEFTRDCALFASVMTRTARILTRTLPTQTTSTHHAAHAQ